MGVPKGQSDKIAKGVARRMKWREDNVRGNMDGAIDSDFDGIEDAEIELREQYVGTTDLD